MCLQPQYVALASKVELQNLSSQRPLQALERRRRLQLRMRSFMVSQQRPEGLSRRRGRKRKLVTTGEKPAATGLEGLMFNTSNRADHADDADALGETSTGCHSGCKNCRPQSVLDSLQGQEAVVIDSCKQVTQPSACASCHDSMVLFMHWYRSRAGSCIQPDSIQKTNCVRNEAYASHLASNRNVTCTKAGTLRSVQGVCNSHLLAT